MGGQEQNEGIRVLDDFVCVAIQDPRDFRDLPSFRSANEGVRVVEDFSLNGGEAAQIGNVKCHTAEGEPSPNTQADQIELDNGASVDPVVIREPSDEGIELPPSEELAERSELRLWREQLSLYREELARAKDPAHKVTLGRLIHELRNKISGH